MDDEYITCGKCSRWVDIYEEEIYPVMEDPITIYYCKECVKITEV
jgi:hypothetical protein